MESKKDFYEKNKLENKIKNVIGWNISELSNNFLNDNGQLKFEEYLFFWKQIFSYEQNYFVILMEKVMELFFVEENMLKFPVDAIGNTMCFLLLFKDCKFFKNEVKKKLKNFINKNHNEKFACKKNIIDILKNIDILLSSENPSVEILKSYLNFNKLEFNENILSVSLTVDKCYYFISIERLFQKNKETRLKMFFILVEHIQKLQEINLENIQFQKNKLFVIINLFIALIFQKNKFQESILYKLKEIFQNFYFWPLRCSAFIERINKRIINEINFPGYNVLKRMSNESFVLGVINRVPVSQTGHFLKWEEDLRTKPIYYLIQNNAKNSFFINVMKLDEKDIFGVNSIKLDKGVPSNAIFLTLLYVLDLNYGITKDDLINMMWMTREQLVNFFEMVLSLADECVRKIIDKSQKINRIKKIKKEIFNTADKNLTQPSPYLKPMRPLNKFPKNFYPEMAPISHLLLTDKNISDPEKYVKDFFNAVTGLYFKCDRTENPLIIKFIIFGGYKILNSVIANYIDLHTQIKNLNKRIKIQFYLIPTHFSAISNYISVNDFQYLYNVFLPFQKNLILPLFDEKEYIENNNSNTYNDISSPGLFYRTIVENYVKKAHETANICLFKSVIWNFNTNQENGDKKHYFEDHIQIDFDNIDPSNAIISLVSISALGNEKPKLEQSCALLEKILIENIPISKTKNSNPFEFYLNCIFFFSDRNLKLKIQSINVEVCVKGLSVKTPLEKLTDIHRVEVSPVEVNKKNLRFPVQTFAPFQYFE